MLLQGNRRGVAIDKLMRVVASELHNKAACQLQSADVSCWILESGSAT
jgi:hypothetical protein